MLRKFDEANQVTAALTAMAVEQVFAGIDVKRGPVLCVQRTESHELRSTADAASGPVAPLQILQQRNALFELFQILAHEADVPSRSRVKERQPAFPGKDGGRRSFSKCAGARSGEEMGRRWARAVADYRGGGPVRRGSIHRSPPACVARRRRVAEKNPAPKTSGGAWKGRPRDGDPSPAAPPLPSNSPRQSSAAAPHCGRSSCNACKGEKTKAGR